MEPPRSYKDVQKLTGRLAALRRFISKSGDRNLPFFKKLCLASKEEFIWDSQCDVAFEELKQYLGSPKLLTRPEEGEELQLYLAVSKGAVNSSGRLTTWAVELSEFEINYAPRTETIEQVLTDFIMESNAWSTSKAPSQEKALEEAPKWIMYVDGVSNDKGAGAGILIHGVHME
ncbi:hypothetical protein LIER_11609 [Lithospermum erythrorhizon]|uniref:Reverse transcriptase/retrotransposon-derived protein RNase H-like domain-containing protein n=1 Tax=Lithospermum erythrorhizon TaxID=34254 RepID=A0AAV3PNP5_LITER